MKYSVSIKQLDGSYKIYLKEASPFKPNCAAKATL